MPPEPYMLLPAVQLKNTIYTIHRNIIGANGVPECIPVSQADNTTVRLDILMSEDKKFARLQLLKYENYIFHPATDMFFYSTPEAGRIHELITNHRKE